MALTYIKRGRALDYIPDADVPAGTAIKVGAFVGVTNHYIPAGKLGTVELDGIYAIPLAQGASFEQGAIVAIDSDGNAAQVRMSDLLPQQIPAASIDFINGIFIARQPFVPGTSEVFVNGLRYLPVRDYKELAGDDTADGFELPGIESSDEIILKAIPVIN